MLAEATHKVSLKYMKQHFSYHPELQRNRAKMGYVLTFVTLTFKNNRAPDPC